MASETSKITGFAVDNASGTLTNISTATNNVDVAGGTEQYEDTGLSDTRHTFVLGLGAPVTVTANGWLNSTTRAIMAPLVNGTSVDKTIEVKYATGDYYSGEAIPGNVQLGLPTGAVNTWSCTFQANNGLTATSVTGVA